MKTIMIQIEPENAKIMKTLAKKLGGKAIDINEEELEDYFLGKIIEKAKTEKNVSDKTLKFEVIETKKNKLLSEIEQGLKEVKDMQNNNFKKRTLSEILNEK